ncbi:MAG: hypothetical protein QUS33_00500 [Dehalococcoidia bacterium]|nr:hypothetical protein [Dehalococcoidia bacterium]
MEITYLLIDTEWDQGPGRPSWITARGETNRSMELFIVQIVRLDKDPAVDLIPCSAEPGYVPAAITGYVHLRIPDLA